MRTKIHVWGGLGSQLYSFALLITLLEHYPSRKFKIVFHTGGVTERHPEIVPLIQQLCTWSICPDFKEVSSKVANPITKQNSDLTHNLKILLKSSLLKLGFVKLCNEPIPKLFPWTLSIRGHYRHLYISQSVLMEIVNSISSRIQTIEPGSGCTLHFRLGDLIGLKETISPEILRRLIEEIADRQEVDVKFDVYSDSPQLAEKMLTSKNTDLKLGFPELDIWSTVINCINSQNFVGTNSKISYWVSYLRLSLNKMAVTYLPSDLKNDLSNTLGDLSIYGNLNFFSEEYRKL